MKAPDRGDLVYMDFDPQTGHEQKGRRPAIVLSDKKFNEVTKFASLCPITNTVRGWGFEIPLPEDSTFTGVILADQIRNLDWSAREIQVKGKTPDEVVQACIEKIHTFLYC
ncbi:type II toxin-antitoxin system PemK/MazF family toxin [Amphibacillus sp. Q70]|uniref:type II toxin-antitoxin system PemK/MazF family toxin n=1 Tax=Amphibacillus sp. Q70 TaxID=3453416 RepID=UPI003F853124